jgi:hypothetical protein
MIGLDGIVEWRLSIFIYMVNRRPQFMHHFNGFYFACTDCVVNGILTIDVKFIDIQPVFTHHLNSLHMTTLGCIKHGCLLKAVLLL